MVSACCWRRRLCFGRGRDRGFVLYIFPFLLVWRWWMGVCLHMHVHTKFRLVYSIRTLSPRLFIIRLYFPLSHTLAHSLSRTQALPCTCNFVYGIKRAWYYTCQNPMTFLIPFKVYIGSRCAGEHTHCRTHSDCSWYTRAWSRHLRIGSVTGLCRTGTIEDL